MSTDNPMDPFAENPPRERQSRTLLFVILGILGALLVAGIVLLVLLLKTKDESASPGTSPSTATRLGTGTPVSAAPPASLASSSTTVAASQIPSSSAASSTAATPTTASSTAASSTAATLTTASSTAATYTTTTTPTATTSTPTMTTAAGPTFETLTTPMTEASCSMGGPGFDPTRPPVKVSWTSTKAAQAWFVQGTSDAADSGYMQIPVNGTQADFPFEIQFACGTDSSTYTITLVGTDGSHLSKSWTVQNTGDVF
ncbi:hypothetical protein [Nakamurella antarctica]|uniref:hypothetical protein n=1 Tax=Nakamurella antarctica TaxID=1902245 RepID=UPI0019D1E6B3|nr:hypothetical protein [Nakamurella antarctica]